MFYSIMPCRLFVKCIYILIKMFDTCIKGSLKDALYIHFLFMFPGYYRCIIFESSSQSERSPPYYLSSLSINSVQFIEFSSVQFNFIVPKGKLV